MSVSALVMCRNGADYLRYALASVVNHVDEFIICDTGSMDRTIDVIFDFRKRYAIPVVFFKEAIGESIEDIAKHGSSRLTELRNEMIALATGDWLMILDHDEIWDRDTIHAQIALLPKLSPTIQYVANRAISYVKIKPRTLTRFDKHRIRFFRNKQGIVFRRKFPYETLSYPSSYPVGQHLIAKVSQKNRMLYYSPFFFHHFSLSKKCSVRNSFLNSGLLDKDSNLFEYPGLLPEVMRKQK